MSLVVVSGNKDVGHLAVPPPNHGSKAAIALQSLAAIYSGVAGMGSGSKGPGTMTVQITHTLGAGVYGTVYRMTVNGKHCAVKVISSIGADGTHRPHVTKDSMAKEYETALDASNKDVGVRVYAGCYGTYHTDLPFQVIVMETAYMPIYNFVWESFKAGFWGNIETVALSIVNYARRSIGAGILSIDNGAGKHTMVMDEQFSLPLKGIDFDENFIVRDVFGFFGLGRPGQATAQRDGMKLFDSEKALVFMWEESRGGGGSYLIRDVLMRCARYVYRLDPKTSIQEQWKKVEDMLRDHRPRLVPVLQELFVAYTLTDMVILSIMGTVKSVLSVEEEQLLMNVFEKSDTILRLTGLSIDEYLIFMGHLLFRTKGMPISKQSISDCVWRFYQKNHDTYTEGGMGFTDGYGMLPPPASAESMSGAASVASAASAAGGTQASMRMVCLRCSKPRR